MKAMLNGDFREAHANVVSIFSDSNQLPIANPSFPLPQIVLPGVTEYTFHKLLCFVYTDEIPAITPDKCLNLLELANRMCLPRLLNLVECRVVESLTRLSQTENPEATEQCLKLLEPVKVRHCIAQGFISQTTE